MKNKNLYILSIFFSLFVVLSAAGQTFNDLKATADTHYKNKKYADAKKFYERASRINPADKYCSDQIAICDRRIKAQASGEKFDQVVQKADENFELKYFEEAKRFYQEALKLKRDDFHCGTQLIECDVWLALEKSDLPLAESNYRMLESKKRNTDLEMLLAQKWADQKADNKAIEWYKKVADGGNKQAKINIANLLIKTGKDDLLAIDWINKAGEDPSSYYKIIGDRIWKSAGMQVSKFEQALLYYGQSNIASDELKGKYVELGDILVKLSKIEEANLYYAKGGKDIRMRTVEEGQRLEGYSKYDKAEEAYLKAATAGYLDGYKKLGDLYWNGFSENSKNNSRYLLAIGFYEKANIPNLSEIYVKAAMLYIGDKATVKDAEQLLLKATNLPKKDDKTTQAYYLLGVLYYEDDKGLKKDLTKAEAYFKAAAESNHIASQKKLADIYLRKKKFNDAYQWFQKLDSQNDPFGSYGMGNLLYNGLIKNVKNNREEGVKLIIKAAEMGSKEALNSLNTLSEESPNAKEAYNRISGSKKN